YCSFQAITDRLFRDRNLRYRQLALTNDDRTKIELIGAGLGVSLVEKAEAEAAAATGRVFIWPTEQIKVDLVFAHLSRRAEDPLIRALGVAVMEIWDRRETSSVRRLRAVE
ncbi:MAG: LysR substrate-binding domain-containing protein, partial [Blastocatellia bacterium]